jgi:TolA-binding protein
VLSFFQQACFHSASSSSKEIDELKKQVAELQQKQLAQEAQIAALTPVPQFKGMPPQAQESLKNIAAALTPGPDTTTSKDDIPKLKAPVLAPLKESGATAEAVVAPGVVDNGGDAYSQAIKDAKKKDLTDLQRDAEAALRSHHDSPATINIMFLYAKELSSRGNFQKSAEQFERLYKMFPDGNKAVSALFELGLCYQKMGNAAEAMEAFQNVETIYPGSAEAHRANQLLQTTGG